MRKFYKKVAYHICRAFPRITIHYRAFSFGILITMITSFMLFHMSFIIDNRTTYSRQTPVLQSIRQYEDTTDLIYHKWSFIKTRQKCELILRSAAYYDDRGKRGCFRMYVIYTDCNLSTEMKRLR